jgi:hypothetical protein
VSQDISTREARAIAEADVRRLFFRAKLVLTVTYCALVVFMLWVA